LGLWKNRKGLIAGILLNVFLHKRIIMKMLLVVFRQSLEEDVLTLLSDLNVQAFTESPKVFGVGEAGSAFSSIDWPGHNCMIFSALPDEQAEVVVRRLRSFCDELSQRQHGAKIPLRIFLFPCEQAR
jgi:hypothetical protein